MDKQTLARPDDRLLRKYGTAAPRYTSYPTAVQFTAAYGPDQHAAALRRLPADEPVSLYAHIPFCEQLCWYCGCNTRAVRRRGTVSRYMELLTREIALVGDALPTRLNAYRIHLGGGTPNMTSAADLDAVFGALRQTFDVSDAAVISTEIDPRVLSRDWVGAAAAHGLNRASIGVQDLSPAVQAAVNRREGFDVVERAVDWLRAAGVGSLNFDLMYGLPRQTVQNVAETLRRVLTLRPDRLALFGYAHVPWAKPHQKLIRDEDLPGPQERLGQSRIAAEILAAEGYVAIGMDHFALPGDPLAIAQATGGLRRNFQGYTDDTAAALVGFGASAISQLPQGMAQNQSQERLWRAAVAEGRLPTARGVPVTREDRLRGAIIEQLMGDFRADIPAIRARLGDQETSLEASLAALEELADDGLVETDAGRIRITDSGRPFLRAVCLAFDAYFVPAAERHSTAV